MIKDLGLTDDEVALYDALVTNGSMREIMGREKPKLIATKLITQIRKSVTFHRTLREGA